MNTVVAGVDVGGTSIKSFLVDSAGHVTDAVHLDTRPGNVVEQACHVARTIVDKWPEVAGIGVITPGVADEEAGVIKYASNLELKNVNLAQRMQEACLRPVRLGHDGRAAGLAEGLLGAGQGAPTFIMVPIGTGISAAICHGNRPWAGDAFSAGEVGHTPVIPNGEACTCGQRGCTEVYASAKAIARRFTQKTGKEATARTVEDLLGIDPIADEVWDTATYALALCFAHLTFALDPTRFVVGGGLSNAGETLLEPVRRHLRDLMAWRTPPEIVTARLGAEAGKWGAAILGAQAANRQIWNDWKINDGYRAMC